MGRAHTGGRQVFGEAGQQRAATATAVVGLLVAAAIGAGCGGGDAYPPTIDSTVGERLPIANTYLDRSYRLGGGLMRVSEADGYPVREGAEIDPLVVEARRFYDTLGAPGALPRILDYPDPFTGAEGTPRTTAPLTFEEWKQAFGFLAPLPDETREAWRQRAGVVVYYNVNELGLGRELGCAEFDDGAGDDGQPRIGIACFVTNFGAAFSDMHNSTRAAVDGTRPKNTVCISYRPSLGADYEVQFYVYGREGKRQEWAQLDTLGPRPHPFVCTNCHGGTYDDSRHLARSARFLPIDPAVVRFADAPASVTREGQEDQLRKLNGLAFRTPLTDGQKELFTGLYGGEIDVPGRAAEPFVPAGWSDSAAHRDLYQQVVKPYCGTCHLAMDRNSLTGAMSTTYAAMQSAAAFAKIRSGTHLCSFQMPNAQPTMRELWRVRPEPLMIGGHPYATAADALLREMNGMDRAACFNLDTVSDCRRGGDGLCGDSRSGTACDPDSGRCVPMLGDSAPADPAAPTGVCKMDGTRRCPAPQECQPVSSTLAGYDGACFLCGGMGQRACATSTVACEAGMAPDADNLCAPAGIPGA